MFSNHFIGDKWSWKLWCLLFDESKRSAPSSPSFHKACSLCATGAEMSQYLPSSDVLKIPGPVRSSNPCDRIKQGVNEKWHELKLAVLLIH